MYSVFFISESPELLLTVNKLKKYYNNIIIYEFEKRILSDLSEIN